MVKGGKIVLRLCSSCESRDAPEAFHQLESAIAAANLPVPVQMVPQICMNGCSAPISLALQGYGMATYFFNGIDVEADRDDIINTLRAYIDSPSGWIEDATSCGRLRLCLKGRVPAILED